MVVLGVMSGTSLDGVDLALVKFQETAGKLGFEFLNSVTVSYSGEWHQSLLNGHMLDVDSLNNLSTDYGSYLAEIIKSFLRDSSIQPDLIASHGHTILHQPEKGITVQIGNGPEIFNTLGIPVVCDFRVQDVKLGGQGAPLVPIGDRLLFSEYDCCVNLGGFINISYEDNANRMAYDVCPMNIVMNDLSVKLGLPYDDKGSLAKSGKLNQTALVELNALEFYKQPAPKSLGKEWVLENIWPRINKLKPEDALRTFVEHNAQQLAKNIQGKPKVLLTGGGVYNTFFYERLSQFSKSELIVLDKEIIEFKESLIFALLGYLKWNDRINVLSTVTGAIQNHSSGVVYL